MAREKSPLTREIIFSVGRILSALTSKSIAEDDIRTACRTAGIAALGQGELTSCLKEFRESIPTTPKEKLSVLADIIPEGVLMSLLLVAQESVNAQMTKVHQANLEANMTLQTAMAALENERAEALATVKAKEADCASLSTELESAQNAVANLTERIAALEKENTLMRGRLLERDETRQKKASASEKRAAKNAGRSAVKMAIAKKHEVAGAKKNEVGGAGHSETGSAEIQTVAGGAG